MELYAAWFDKDGGRLNINTERSTVRKWIGLFDNQDEALKEWLKRKPMNMDNPGAVMQSILNENKANR